MNIKKGIALIIANSDYQSQPKLASCLYDGHDMQTKLKELDFDIVLSENETRSKLYETISKFLTTADSYSTILFYYSGHGVQIDGNNYIVPIDFEYKHNKQLLINNELVGLDILTDYCNLHQNKTNIIVLDACRNNLTFAKSLQNTGLAPMACGSGTFIAFATAPNTSAFPALDKDRNSVYTKYLLKHINKVNTKIEDMFKFVRIDVQKATQNIQNPWDHTSLKSNFYFNTMPQDTINETIYQLVRSNDSAETLLYLSDMTQLPISNIMRIYEHQKNEKVGGLAISSQDSFEEIILNKVLSYGFDITNYRWCYKDTPVIMGDFLHNPKTYKKL